MKCLIISCLFSFFFYRIALLIFAVFLFVVCVFYLSLYKALMFDLLYICMYIFALNIIAPKQRAAKLTFFIPAAVTIKICLNCGSLRGFQSMNSFHEVSLTTVCHPQVPPW